MFTMQCHHMSIISTGMSFILSMIIHLASVQFTSSSILFIKDKKVSFFHGDLCMLLLPFPNKEQLRKQSDKLRDFPDRTLKLAGRGQASVLELQQTTELLMYPVILHVDKPSRVINYRNRIQLAVIVLWQDQTSSQLR